MNDICEFAEHANYWKTSRSSPDAWMDKTVSLVVGFGGEVLESGYKEDHAIGRCAYVIRFTVLGEVFRVLWPALRSESGDTFAARRQAATMMYHAVKSRCVELQALGARVAFFPWLELPDGRLVFQLANQELAKEVPQSLLLSHEAIR